MNNLLVFCLPSIVAILQTVQDVIASLFLGNLSAIDPANKLIHFKFYLSIILEDIK